MNTELTCPATTSATADSLDGAAWCAAGRMLSILVVAHQTTAPLIRKLFHVAGLHFLFTTLATGGTYVVDGPGDAARFWDVIRARSVTVATLTPNPFDIVEHPDAGRSLDTIRLAFSQQTSEAPVQSFPSVTCATPYGATELGGTALVAFGDDCVRPGAVLGRPLLGMVAAVLDDNDEPVPHGQVGELCFRGAATTPGLEPAGCICRSVAQRLAAHRRPRSRRSRRANLLRRSTEGHG
ncbi:AMP-binding protein [Mycobacterium sp.]|uniref:AMP-binding protein n=1 Tax=Mycobacterium sp. TaxID=1785 RepID=UPI003F9DCF22